MVPVAGGAARAVNKARKGDAIADALRAKYPDVSLSLGGDKSLQLGKIVVPKEQRGQGVGTAVMNDLVRQADEAGAMVTLTPAADFGGNVNRLREFYKRFGFVENKGKNKDFAVSDRMYRVPQQVDIPTDAAVSALRKAPRDEALETARINAVKMLGLPENNTAMDRARAMGFDVEGFHGTNKDFPAFKADMAGKSDYGTIGQGVYIDPSKNAAYSNLVTRIIAKEGGGNVMPLMARSGNVFDAADLPLIHNAERSKAVTENLKAQGFDSVLSKVDGKPSEMVVFDPSRIRSRFAAFDPARINENDLLGRADPRLLAMIAGGGLTGLTVNALRNKRNEEKKEEEKQ
jgi:predicted GNAT family acetyltransferase